LAPAFSRPGFGSVADSLKAGIADSGDVYARLAIRQVAKSIVGSGGVPVGT
jgi:hypothetical protein